MEKISVEELKAMVGADKLSDEELDKVTGGLTCEQKCLFYYDVDDPRLISCKVAC